MKKKLNLATTGISLVDEAWGGFYRGGSYLLLGPRKSGRTLLALQFAMEAAKNKEVTLFFTSMRPKDLMIHAASIDFDLNTYMNQNLIIVVRVAPPADIYESANPDNYLVEYLNDIASVVGQYNPSRLVFDELTPFVGFENIGLLQQTFLNTIESIEEKNITSLFIVAEPATPFSQMIVDTIAQYSTAIIYLQKNSEEGRIGQGGRATITPNIGHTEGQFTSDYFIEPYRGITFSFEVPQKNAGLQVVPEHGHMQGSQNIVQPAPAPKTSTNSKYKPLTNVDVVQEKFSFSNFYDLSEFALILNNQIALYKSTGQPFTLISFKLDPLAQQQNILSMMQLQNALRLSTDKKDKICVVNNNVLVLISSADDKVYSQLVSKMKSNLPNTDKSYQDLVMQYLFGFPYVVNDKVQNADTLLNEILE
ncbi:MAG: ATPase domain-containing protein [Ignavibacteria bacterium]|nr:ATPase domain-containing protein [Ignavibacteria bacterium]